MGRFMQERSRHECPMEKHEIALLKFQNHILVLLGRFTFFLGWVFSFEPAATATTTTTGH